MTDSSLLHDPLLLIHAPPAVTGNSLNHSSDPDLILLIKNLLLFPAN